MTTVDVTFRGTWLTDAADPTQSLQLWKTDRKEDDEVDAQVRTRAGNRKVIVETPRADRSSQMTFRGVSAADLETLRGRENDPSDHGWRGRVLLLRDPQGWRRWGMFAGVQVQTIYPAPYVPVYEVSLTWLDVTYDESVAI